MRLLALKSILVATDFDDGSRPALRTAARLAVLAEAKLHLFHVASEPKEGAAARLAAYFHDTVTNGPEPDTIEATVGTAAEMIVEHARKTNADALVLGPHRKLATLPKLGGTAARVVQSAPCPCLIAAVELDLPLERVLAPIDLSEIARGALSVALTWASALRPAGAAAHLMALHVANDVATHSHALQAVQEEVERARARAGGAARVEIDPRVVEASDPVNEILQVTAAERPDLIVLGTRGTGARVGLGSVSAAVARVTPRPLLLVPRVTWEDHNLHRRMPR